MVATSTKPAVLADAPPIDAPPIASEFRMVPPADITPSRTNPRKYFDPKALGELTESVKRAGVLVPLITRPLPNGKNGQLELVAGERRLRASKAAGLAQVPVLIRPYTDQQALEAQCIENLEREDVHPLEEADGFAVLIKECGYDVAALAHRISKPEKYVRRRLALRELIDPLRKWLEQGEINIGMAQHLCRLLRQHQEQWFKQAKTQIYLRSSIDRVSDWIERNVHLELKRAAFDVADPTLPGGPCAACPKRTGANPLLFDDVKEKDTCTDPSCYRAKEKAHLSATLVQLATKAKEKGESAPVQVEARHHYSGGNDKLPAGVLKNDAYTTVRKDDRCEHTRQAVVAMPDHENPLGKVLLICSEKTCKKHRGEGRHSAERDHYREKAKAAEEKARLEAEAEARTRDAIVAKIAAPLKRAELEILLESIAHRFWNDTLRKYASRTKLEPIAKKQSWGGTTKDYGAALIQRGKGLDDVGLSRLLVEMCLWQYSAALETAAKHYKVDAEGITRQVQKEHREKQAAKKAKAKAKAKKAKKVPKRAGKNS